MAASFPCLALAPAQLVVRRGLVLLLWLIGAGVALPAYADGALCIANDVISFGNHFVGSATSANVAVTNCGDQSWSFTDVSVDPATGSAFHVNTSCATGLTLPPGATCTVTVEFAPLVTGQTSGGLWLRNTTAGDPGELLTFYGRGIDAQAGTASLTFIPATAAFGEQLLHVQSAPLMLEIHNQGPAALTPTHIVLNGPSVYDFLGVLGTCNVGTAIPAGQSCSLSLYFQPQAAGTRLANLVIDAPQLASLAILQVSGIGATQAVGLAPIPRPSGIYVLNEAANLQSTSTAYAPGLVTSPAYLNDVAGHAIFVPIAKILPSVTTWGQFNWDWTYVDTLVQIAVANGKQFSIELETGFQSSSTYLQSLPAGFAATCGADCAPLFDVWTTGGGAGRCVSAYVLLPWIPNVQQFWNAAALALAAHLRDTGVYGSLTLVHVPGLSVYDEELRLPTGTPSPDPTDTTTCPDGRPAYPTTITDAATSRWQALGYSDAAVISGFQVIATSFAQAFPDRYLGLSLFPMGSKGIDFPNLTGDPVGYVASQIVTSVAALVPTRIQIQSDNLDSNAVDTEVTGLAEQNITAIGWQSNKHGGAGAGCAGGGAGSCAPDGSAGPFFHLLQSAALSGGRYLEVWSSDVVAYPLAFAGARAAGVYQPNYQGIWWVAGGAQSGSGINFAHQGDQVYATWYTYDTSGKAWWLAMLATRTAPGGNVYAGPIYVYSGSPFNNYVGKPSPTQVGSGTLTLSDANTGSFNFAVAAGGANVQQTLPIVRYDTGLGVQPICVSNLALDLAAATNYQGLWWVPGGAETGWGINFAQQGNDIFATWYTYNFDGTPLWLSALVLRQGATNVYTGAIYQTSGPRFDAYDPHLVQTMPVGTATITFADGNDATFAYSVMIAPLPGPVVQTKDLTRYPFTATGGTVCQ